MAGSALLAGLAVATSPADASAPPGQGLETFTAACDTGETVTVVTPLGQAATAFVDGRHVVIESFSISGPEGTFTKTFGVKTGLPTETFTCSLGGGGTFTVVHAPVPPRL